MKMSDVFELPLCMPIGTDAELTDDYCNHIAEFQFIKHAQSAAHAINNHDRLVEALQEAMDILYSIDGDPEITNKMSYYDVNDLRKLNYNLIKAQSK